MTWNKFCGIIALFSVPLCIIGRLADSHNTVLLAAVLIFSCNIIYGLQKPQERIVFLCFLGMIFLFLLGRPVISFFRSYEWWIFNGTISTEAGMFAIFSVYVSLFVLYLAAISACPKELENHIFCSHIIRSSFVKNLELVSLIIFGLALFCAYLEGLERIIFMQTHTYLDMYTGQYITKQPFVVKGFIQLMKPTMCVFLATFPKKRRAFWVLAGYLISTFPSLRVGMRSPTMLACVFILAYYLLRDSLRDPSEPKWFGRGEKAIILISLPFIICFLLVYTEIRNGITSAISTKMEHPLTNFIYEQGTTFTVLSQFYDVQDTLPQIGFPGYLFGYFRDVLIKNGIIRRLLDIPVYVGQSKEFLSVSYDLKQHLSYAVKGDAYFSGFGVGTSYILDVFVDYNWIGLILFNAGLSIFMLNGKRIICKNWLISTVYIYSLLQLFYIPRSTAMEPITFLINPYFWFAVGICWFGAKILTPKYIPREEPRPIAQPLCTK